MLRPPRAPLHLTPLDSADGKAVFRRGSFALLVWDVKRFRTINASFGRDTGDLLLREVARRIASRWPQLMHVARLSADYFAAYIPDAGDAEPWVRCVVLVNG